MKQFLDLLRDIKENGVRKVSRTGVDTVGVVGRQLRFDLANGFPLVTTRPIYTRALIEELLFFIRGSTDNDELNARDVHIWDKWATKEDVTDAAVYSNYELACQLSKLQNMDIGDVQALLNTMTEEQAYAYLQEQDVNREYRKVRVKKNSLGPVYGYLWRHWPLTNGGYKDQLKEAIQMLRSNPFSRRIIVSAWNPEVLPDESKPPHVNAAEGKQCLAACHTFFQLTVTPHRDPEGKTTKGRLHLHLYQRSLDSPVGGPYNIASYSLLLAMLAQITDLEPSDFIWTINDAHIYVDQLELVDEQLAREPQPLPTLWLNPDIKEIDDFQFEDIEIREYRPLKPQIKYPVAV